MITNETEYSPEGKSFHGSIPLVMGTRLEMLVVGHPRDEVVQVWDWLCVEASRLSAALNRFDPESELSKANASASGGRLSPRLMLGWILVASPRDMSLKN